MKKINMAFAGFRHTHIYSLLSKARKNENINICGAWEEYEPDKKTAEDYVNHYGAERLAFGTDYPVWDPVQEVQRLQALNLTDEQKEQIAWKTAARFLSL